MSLLVLINISIIDGPRDKLPNSALFNFEILLTFHHCKKVRRQELFLLLELNLLFRIFRISIFMVSNHMRRKDQDCPKVNQLYRVGVGLESVANVIFLNNSNRLLSAYHDPEDLHLFFLFFITSL